MADLTDGQLLNAFVKTSDSAAFEQVVRRHLDWVYSCARRMVRDAHLAEDVAQAVFILLASKARGLRGREQLGGWLFRATRYCAANALKQQARRKHHEMEARIMQTSNDNDANWDDVYPLLDETVKGLGRGDRDAVLLRFYQGKSLAEVAAAMGISEEAAKKRVQRAVEKLRATMVKKGVTVSASGLASVMAVQITQAAPPMLAGTVMAAGKGAAGATMAGAIAHAAGKLMWWTQAKLAALLLVGSVAGAATCGVAVYALTGQLNQRHGATSTSAADSALPTTASNVFDVLYEKSPGSSANLSMTVGPNTFAVTAVVRYGADGKPVATNALGKSIDPATLHLANAQPPTGANKDVVIVFLDPPPERYDIDRLRVFDHLRRKYLTNVSVTRVPGVSALRLVASAGELPPQIDLWLHVASYDATNLPVSLSPKKDATAAVGTAQVGFADIRDGRWNITGGQFTSRADDSPQTTLELKATGVWDAGRYQIAAITKAKEKYISDFFIDLSSNSMPFLDFPFSLDQIDHFELRPNARQSPFYFDGIILPATAPALPKPNPIPQPVIVDAGTQSRVTLPSGAVVELRGIAKPAPMVKDWWGLDGRPVSLVAKESTGWVSDNDGRLAARVFAGRLFKAPNGQSDVLWQFDPAAGWAGGGSDGDSRITAAVDAHSPVTVRIGAPATPWTTLEEFTPDKLPAESQCWTGGIDALQFTDHGVTLTTSIGNLPSNVWLVLIDDKGQPHWPNETSSSGSHDKYEPWGYYAVRMKFHGLMRDKVHSVRLETRREEFAAFKNVPLEPK